MIKQPHPATPHRGFILTALERSLCFLSADDGKVGPGEVCRCLPWTFPIFHPSQNLWLKTCWTPGAPPGWTGGSTSQQQSIHCRHSPSHILCDRMSQAGLRVDVTTARYPFKVADIHIHMMSQAALDSGRDNLQQGTVPRLWSIADIHNFTYRMTRSQALRALQMWHECNFAIGIFSCGMSVLFALRSQMLLKTVLLMRSSEKWSSH